MVSRNKFNVDFARDTVVRTTERGEPSRMKQWPNPVPAIKDQDKVPANSRGIFDSAFSKAISPPIP